MSLVLGLALALSIPTGLTSVSQAADPEGLGRQQPPAHRVSKLTEVKGLGAKKARDHVAAAWTVNAAQAATARAQQTKTWPHAAAAAATLHRGAPARLTSGGLPVTITPMAGGKRKAAASGQVTVRTLGQDAATAAGIKGVLLSAAAASPGTAELSVNYGAFASAYGGGWAGRLRLVRLPDCVLTTPAKAACGKAVPVSSHNHVSARTLTARVDLSAGPAGTVLALAAGAPGESASGSGNYAATPLASSSAWEAGGSSGAFTWSYDMAAPSPAAGPAPSPSLTYNSGSVDGKTATTNNQTTQVGEGFDLNTASYVERNYGPCDQDGQADKFDQCWKYDNASLVLNGASTELVKDDTTGEWRLKNDDASTVTHSTGADNADEGDDDSDGAGEYWTVTTGDGTKYVFGLNKLSGAGTERTNSVWTVPVFGDDDGEPGYSSATTFSGRSKNQAWRWNLDYVEDLHGNAMSYWYTAESNSYAKNGSDTATAQYTRGGYLTKILYGQNKATLFTADASNKVTLTYDERCTAADCTSLTKDTADKWPDVPYDSICAAGADCDVVAPSFFTRKRLTGVETSVWAAAASPAAYKPVDAWTLTQAFKDGGDIGDTSDQTLTLTSIQHTGKNGSTTPIALDPVTFTYQMRPNRVDAPLDDILPLDRPRIDTITSETGAITTVTLSEPGCVRGSSMPAEDDNTTSCYPQYWHINGSKGAAIDWFNKYRVLAVVSSDPSGHGETMQSAYSYAAPAWHYNDDPFTPEDERTWSLWRGYGQVTTTTGSGSTKSKSVSLYLQGMDGDRTKTGGTRPADVAGIDVAGLDVPDFKDSDPYAGTLREQITYDGTTPVAVSVSDPWMQKTATQHKSYADIEAYYVRTAKTSTHTYLTVPKTWRTTTATTTYDTYGMATASETTGDTAKTGDEACTRTWYARNSALGITSLVSRTRTVGQPCATAETALSLPATSATPGDVLADTATVYDNTTATTWKQDQTPTTGDASWSGRATAYPAAASGGERMPSTWQTLAKSTFDTLGRLRTVTDTANNTTTTAYTPVAAGPLTQTIVTSPITTQKVISFFDPGRGSPLTVFDVNKNLTESAYDALGRITSVWLPNRSHSGNQSANYTYAYHLSKTEPSWVSTATIRGNNVYNTSYTLYDALLRPLQTQVPAADGGRLLSDTRYDSRGLAYESFADIPDTTHAPNSEYSRAEYGGAPKQVETVFDGAGRAVTSSLLVFGVKKQSSTTSYTGDSTATTALDGGSATRVITDAQGRTTERREYAGASPADTGYGGALGAAHTSTSYTYTSGGQPKTVTGPDNSSWTYSYDLFGRQTSVSDPDKGTTTTGYTPLDQPSWSKDAAGRVLITAYDVLGRPTGTWKAPATADLTSTLEEQIPANQLTSRTYDTLAKGQLDASTRYVGGSGTTGTAYTRKVTAYDTLYRVTGSQLTLPATDQLVTLDAVKSPLTFTTAYNLDGTQQNTSEPAAGGMPSEIIQTHYNAAGLPTDVGGTSSYLLGASYSATGLPETLTLGTSAAEGIKHTHIGNTYEDGTDRLTQSKVTDDTHSYELQELNYTYDQSGNVTALSDPTTLGGTGKADNQCFSYDGYQRLTDAWTPTTADCATTGRTTNNIGGAAPYWTSYTYTNGGQRSTETNHTTNTTRNYCYTKLAQPHTLTATTTAACTAATAQYTYDTTGNTLTRPDGSATQALTWNEESDLAQTKETAGSTTSTTNYIYDADGELLIRRNTAGESILYLDGITEVHLDTTTTTPKYWANRTYTVGGTTIATRTNKSGAPALVFLTSDHHGTGALAIDAGTTQALSKRYTTPFGAPRGTTTGTAWPDDKAFLGKPADTTTGLTHIGAREYDPGIGQFISVDPVLTLTQHQSLNGYSYAGNNPVTSSDPTGMCPADVCGNGYPIGGTGTGKNNPVRVVHNAPDMSQTRNAVVHIPKGNTGGTNHTNSGGSWGLRFVKTFVGQAKNLGTSIWDQGVEEFEQDRNCVTSGDSCFEIVQNQIEEITGAATVNALYARGSEIYSDFDNGRSAEGSAKITFDVSLLVATHKAGKKFNACHSFLPGTGVLLANGKRKAIEDVEAGDVVVTTDAESGETVAKKVVDTITTEDDKAFTKIFISHDGDQSSIVATDTHPFWVPDLKKWVKAGDLQVGQSLRTSAGRRVQISEVTHYTKRQRTHDLTIADIHAYYVLAGATPVLVHNCGGTRFSVGSDGVAEDLANALPERGGYVKPPTLEGGRMNVVGNKIWGNSDPGELIGTRTPGVLRGLASRGDAEKLQDFYQGAVNAGKGGAAGRGAQNSRAPVNTARNRVQLLQEIINAWS
ncbi:polymorphic toxin-type HINT domain-containing protein [Streptomyces sp. NPDC001822]|uniref:polymorphic toxin-type HINT domain-containing protein n=1 Tax=Streptomyces sp. NPDC001822 TaxID=3364614 RepID=UPI0036BCF5C1